MIFLAVAFAILGAILASFVNVIVERLNTGQSWTKGRSRCSSCSAQLKSGDMVPVISWLLLRGRCRLCGSRIPYQLLLSEIILGTLFALAYVHIGLTPTLGIFLLFVSILLGVVIYDIRHTIVPPRASFALVLLGAVFLFLSTNDASSAGVALMTAGAIGFSFFLLHVCSKGRAMGLGDTPVVLALSLLCAPYALGGVLFSFWIGAVVGVMLLVLSRGGSTMGTEVPFVPFLALGFLLSFFTSWNPFILG